MTWRTAFRILGAGVVFACVVFTISTVFYEFWDAVGRDTWFVKTAIWLLIIMPALLVGGWLGDVVASWMTLVDPLEDVNKNQE